MAIAELEKKLSTLNDVDLQAVAEFIDFLLFRQQHSIRQMKQSEPVNGFLSLAGKIDIDEQAVHKLREESMI